MSVKILFFLTNFYITIVTVDFVSSCFILSTKKQNKKSSSNPKKVKIIAALVATSEPTVFLVSCQISHIFVYRLPSTIHTHTTSSIIINTGAIINYESKVAIRLVRRSRLRYHETCMKTMVVTEISNGSLFILKNPIFIRHVYRNYRKYLFGT